MKKLSLIMFVFLLCTITALGQTDVEILIKKSEEASRRGKFPEALAALTKAIKMQPDNADLYVRRSVVHQATGNKEGIVHDVKKAAALAPDNKQIVLNAASHLTYFRQCIESLNILNDYIYKDATSADVFNSRSYAKLCLDDLLGAYDDLSTAIELAPDKSAYRAAQAELLPKLGNSEEAFERFAQLIKTLQQKLAKANPKFDNSGLKSDLAWVYQVRARVFHSKGDTQAEFADLAKYVEYDHKFHTFEHRARIYIDHERYQEAIADFTEAIRLANHPPMALLIQRGETYILIEKYAEAANDYEEALKIEGIFNVAFKKQRLFWLKQKMAENGNQPK